VFDKFNISKRQEIGRLLVDWYTHHARLALFALMVFFLVLFVEIKTNSRIGRLVVL